MEGGEGGQGAEAGGERGAAAGVGRDADVHGHEVRQGAEAEARREAVQPQRREGGVVRGGSLDRRGAGGGQVGGECAREELPAAAGMDSQPSHIRQMTCRPGAGMEADGRCGRMVAASLSEVSYPLSQRRQMWLQRERKPGGC